MDGGGGKSVVVVGAGIVGAATAYFLSRRGYRVRLIEAQAPAAAASGAADGAVSVASKRPGPMMTTALAGIALYRQLDEEGLFAGLFKQRPTVMVAEDDSEVESLTGHADALADGGQVRFSIDGALVGTSVRAAGVNLRWVRIGNNSKSYENFWYDDLRVTPEPASMLLLLVGGALLPRRRR